MLACICELVNHFLAHKKSNADAKQEKKTREANQARISRQQKCRDKECCRSGE
jgi:hypothetical protein